VNAREWFPITPERSEVYRTVIAKEICMTELRVVKTDPRFEPVVIDGKTYITSHLLHKQKREGGLTKHERHDHFMEAVEAIDSFELLKRAGHFVKLVWREVKSSNSGTEIIGPLMIANSYNPVLLLDATAQKEIEHFLDDEASKVSAANSSFVEPHYIKELGCEGLTSDEIAKSIGMQKGHMHTLIERLRQDGDLIEVSNLETLNSNGVKVKLYAVNIEDAKFIVTQSSTKIGRKYCRYLIEQEKKALNYENLTPRQLRQLADLIETRDVQAKQLEETNKKLEALTDDLKNPTEIGSAMGGIPPNVINNYLQAMGLQYKQGKKWKPTAKANDLHTMVEVKTDYYGGRQLLWKASKLVPAIEAHLKSL